VRVAVNGAGANGVFRVAPQRRSRLSLRER